MSQQSEMADSLYRRLSKGPISSALIVADLRGRWGPDFNVSAVHGFVREVATCLLHHDDVQIGDILNGQFVSWNVESWEADTRIDEELMAMSDFLLDTNRYVFRKSEPNQSPDRTPPNGVGQL